MTLKYHQKTFNLLERQPVVSEDALKQLAAAEKRCGISFPPSVREWYSLEGAMKLLQDYGCIQEPSFERIHEIGEKWHGVWTDVDESENQNVGKGFLVILHDYDGVFQWAVKLDDSDDPPVFIEIDSAPKVIWQRYANRFSEFVYHWFWSTRYWFGYTESKTLELRARSPQRLSQYDLAFLCQHFQQEPTITPIYSSKVEYNFSQADQQITVGLDDEKTYWQLLASSPASLFELADKLWHCGGLSDTLEVPDWTTPDWAAKRVQVQEILTKLKQKNKPIRPVLGVTPNLKDTMATEDSPSLSLYTRGSQDEFLRLFERPLSQFYDSQFVVVPNKVLVFLRVKCSDAGFANPSEVNWTTKQPYQPSHTVPDDSFPFLQKISLHRTTAVSPPFVEIFPGSPFAYVPLFGTTKMQPPFVELFLSKDGKSYLYVGQAQAVSYHYIYEQNFGDISFSLKKPLPTTVFESLGGYQGWRVIIENQQYTFPDWVVPADIATAVEKFETAHVEAVCWSGHELFMLIDEKQATLMHRCQSGDSIAESSQLCYQGSAQAVSVFQSEYWPRIEVPTKHVISREAGIGALLEFLKTGQRPKSIAWTYNNEEHCFNRVSDHNSAFDEDVPF